ncbi:MAG: efflux RND transporter periplasmic adaptor subunit [Candidatus Eisenbacteria bacterium]|nr:efflux RND transporter periplasmic adaptor subunit [Candidatus Eisenbacteria bacterium]
MNSAQRSGFWPKVWQFVRIMNVRLRFVFLMVAVGLIAANLDHIANRWERWTRPKQDVGAASSEYEHYCGMHPSVVRGEPSSCPICGMPLAKRMKGEAVVLPEGTLARVSLSPQRIALAGIGVSEIGYRHLEARIRAVGTVEIDERRTANVAARVGGRVEATFVDFTGTAVEAGEPLVEIYSPELISAQREYLLALKRADEETLVDAAREKLRLWGLYDQQIEAIAREGRPRETIVIRSPAGGIVTSRDVVPGQYVEEGAAMYAVADLSRVWVIAFVNERDAARAREGQSAEIRVHGLADRSFSGTIAFLWPTLDLESRTLRVRIDAANPDLSLRPGMYVDVLIDVTKAEEMETGGTSGASVARAQTSYECSMCPEVSADAPGSCPKCGMFLQKVVTETGGGGGGGKRSSIVVPESAVIDLGARKIVYLEREPGVFDALEVSLGEPSEGFYPVVSGVRAGDRVVTAGAFLVDAESRLNPAVAGSYFGASGGAHSHETHGEESRSETRP